MALPGDLNAGRPATHPALAYTPDNGWSSYPPLDPVPLGSNELWLRQVVVEVPSRLAPSLKHQISPILDSGAAAALAGVDCYALSGNCWEAKTQPVSSGLTVRSFGFPTRAASKEFADHWAAQELESDAVKLSKVFRTPKAWYGLLTKPERDQTAGDWATEDGREQPLDELKSFQWILYATRAFFTRFYALAKQADSADIFVMMVAYLLMHSTFVSLFLNMRRLSLSLKPNSRSHGFWLASSAFISSCVAFMSALLAANYLGISVNPVLLGEALPFLVITIGFEKPFVLTQAVFSNPAIAPSGAYSNSRGNATPSRDSLSPSLQGSLATGFPASSRFGMRFAPPVPSREIVMSAITKTGVPIIRDYAIEVGVLVLGAMSGVAGLKEFCLLAAVILCFDCLFLMSFYVAVLTVMVEVHRIKVIRLFQRSDSSADLTKLLDDPDADRALDESAGSDDDEAPLSLKDNVIKLVTGAAPGQTASGSPTARLKVLLIAAFLVLHAFNLVTTLTRDTALDRHHRDQSLLSVPKLDSQSPVLNAALAQLIASHPSETALVVHVAPELRFRAVDPSAPVEPVRAAAVLSPTHEGSLAKLDQFMSRWSRLVGDPIISKWIVIALGISVFLNGYLLKGISSGSDSGFAPGSAAEAAARILLASTGGVIDEEDSEVRAKLRRSFSVIREDLQRDWTEEDAAAMTRAHIRHENAAEAVAAEPIPTVIKVTAVKDKKADDESSSSDSPPASPIFVRPKNRKNKARSADTTPIPTTPANGLGLTTTPQLVLPTGAEREIHLSKSTVALVGLGDVPDTPRDLETCVKIFAGGEGATLLNDEEIILLVQKGKAAAYALEKLLGDLERAVAIRRALISRASVKQSLETSNLPYQHFDYSRVMGQCCENVVGYMPIPVGIAGPLRIDGQVIPIPMATTEGALVASTSRGCKALNVLGGVTTVVTQDAMTRGPALAFPSLIECAAAKRWIDSDEGATLMKAAFNATSRFARLQSLKTAMAGRTLYVRFATQTGDAMGMNMISKGTEAALDMMSREHFPTMKVAALSGNYCIDKKPAAINWVLGRGKSVVAEGIIPGDTVKSVLKTTVDAMVKLNIQKNLVGSAMAGAMGGFNAHAANNLAAIFLATGQDPAQVVESSQCITLMEAVNDGQDLLITCSMPCIEVGTVGGGTTLLPQSSMLDLLDCRGPHPTHPGQNAQQLARVICAAVVAGELSLMASLSVGTLVKSHLALNRSAPATGSSTPVPHGAVSGALPNGAGGHSGAPAARVKGLTPSTPIRP